MGQFDWEKKIFQIVDNYNNTAHPALGGRTPNSVTEVDEYKVRLARGRMSSVPPLLDWRQKLQNIKDWKLRASREELKPGSYVYLRMNQKALGKSFDT